MTAEHQRRDDALFALIAHHARDLISTYDADGVFTSLSPACRRMFGYEPEELIGTRGIDLVHPDDRAQTVAARMGAAQEPEITSVVRVVRKDGSFLWIESNSHIVRNSDTGQIVEVISIARDITERKQAEETARVLEASLRASEANAAAMLDAIPDLMFRMAADGTFLDFRAAAEHELYVAPERIIGGSVQALMPPAFAAECLRHIRTTLETGARQCWEFQLPLPSGAQDFEARMVPAESTSVLAIVRNISASKAEGAIRHALREKEVMLREIHHRVKNNLQVISSLLTLQAMHIPDAAAREAFERSRSRVHSIALVHEKLYQAKDLSHVDFAEYTQVLVENLLHAHDAAERGISAAVRVEEHNLAVTMAIPCGLIVNELVTNALKHGFPAGRRGAVEIALARLDPGTLELRVADDGIGLPPGLDLRRSASLGLDIVFAFAEQLDAEVDVQRDQGTSYRLRFPCGGAE